MAKHILIPEELEYLFEDGFPPHGESLVRSAIVQLVANHREEYEELAGTAIQNEIDDLKTTVAKQSDRIRKLEALNPKMVNVPILSETANKLQKAVVQKEDKKSRKRRRF